MATETQTPQTPAPTEQAGPYDVAMVQLLTNNTQAIKEQQTLCHQMTLGLVKEMCPSAFNLDKPKTA